jgi:hypothetical protein
MKNAKIIGLHSFINGSYCLDCFMRKVKIEAINMIERLSNLSAWKVMQEQYTVSMYDTNDKKLIGDVFEVVRDDRENVDRQNMDDYPQGLVCKTCQEVIVSRWEDDGNQIHFKNGEVHYGLVYKKGNGPIDAYFVTAHPMNNEEVVVTDVMCGNDDYYEIDSLYESLAVVTQGKNSYVYDVFIHGRNDFYVIAYQTKEHIPVYQNENGWTFIK